MHIPSRRSSGSGDISGKRLGRGAGKLLRKRGSKPMRTVQAGRNQLKEALGGSRAATLLSGSSPTRESGGLRSRENSPERSVVDIGAVLTAAFGSFKATIDVIPRTSLGSFIDRRGGKIAGVYLIYGGNGDLLYVGKSNKVIQRLRQHVSVSGDAGSTLLGDIARERKYPPARDNAHKCPRCKAVIACDQGEFIVPVDQRRFDLSDEMKTTCKVAVIQASDLVPVRKEDLEKFVQYVLRPQYGFYMSEDGA